MAGPSSARRPDARFRGKDAPSAVGRLARRVASAWRASSERRALAAARTVLHVGHRRMGGVRDRAWSADAAFDRLVAPVSSFAWSLGASAEALRFPGTDAYFELGPLTAHARGRQGAARGAAPGARRRAIGLDVRLRLILAAAIQSDSLERLHWALAVRGSGRDAREFFAYALRWRPKARGRHARPCAPASGRGRTRRDTPAHPCAGMSGRRSVPGSRPTIGDSWGTR